MKSANPQIKKLNDSSLESISGGANAATYICDGGAIAAIIGFFGYCICGIASMHCKNRNPKVANHFDTAGDIFSGLAYMGGATFIASSLINNNPQNKK